MPLHLVELVQHIWLNRDTPEARVIYFPKLENDEEAVYLAATIDAAERAVARRYPSYPLGSVRVILVFENPRAIFRIREMGEALYPYFLGGSLGWHDFLASTARLFRHDSSYRIPVKADPDIVIRNIKESHDILVRDLSEAGALKIGGMYGILYQPGDIESFAACMVGYIRDVVTQLKRGLDGFWVAHPDFVRIGIALVEAWGQQQAAPESTVLHDLVRALVPLKDEHPALLAFIDGPDIAKLDESDPRYLRAVLASEIGVSPVIANDDPDEVRYNVFQALQYLADWLRGNGCVALPAKLKLGQKPVFVRVMDDQNATDFVAAFADVLRFANGNRLEAMHKYMNLESTPSRAWSYTRTRWASCGSWDYRRGSGGRRRRSQRMRRRRGERDRIRRGRRWRSASVRHPFF